MKRVVVLLGGVAAAVLVAGCEPVMQRCSRPEVAPEALLLEGCERGERAEGVTYAGNPEPPEEPEVDDPEPEHETTDDPDYRAWRERQGRPLP